MPETRRTFEVVEMAEDHSGRRFLPSRLMILRPDGGYEPEPALLTGNASYTYILSDPELARELNEGRKRVAVKWASEDCNEGRTVLRAMCAYFL